MIWAFHGSDYEECRLLGYKNPVHTSQETHYVLATESSRLMLCKIWSFHGGDYEEFWLLGCYAVRLLLRTDVSEERIASIIMVTGIGELGTILAVTSNRSSVSLMMETIGSFGTSFVTKASRRHIAEDGILHRTASRTTLVFFRVFVAGGNWFM
jgi:hypothetical protein